MARSRCRGYHTLSVTENAHSAAFTAHSRSGRHLTREEAESRCHELLVCHFGQSKQPPRD